MSLHLIAMFIHTPEEVSTSKDIQHHPPALINIRFSPCEVSFHLYPFSLQCATFPSPLPPLLAPYLVHAMVPQLSDDRVGCI